jgi:hypothetical protein
VPKTFEPTRPALLGQTTNLSQGQALYKSDLTGDSRYRAFDLCELDANGNLQKALTFGAASKFVLANHDWPGFKPQFLRATRLARPMWTRRFLPADQFIMAYAGAWAENLRGTTHALELNATAAKDEAGNDIGWAEVAVSTTNPHVQILYPVYELQAQIDPAAPSGDVLALTEDAMQRYAVGDYKVPVLVKFLEGACG